MTTWESHCALGSLQWRHIEQHGVSNHQPQDSLFNRLARRRWHQRLRLRVTGLCEGNSPVTGGFAAQRASNAEHVCIWWRHLGRTAHHLCSAVDIVRGHCFHISQIITFSTIWLKRHTAYITELHIFPNEGKWVAGYLKQIPPFHHVYRFLELLKHWLPYEITFRFYRCCHS